jgi:hypothetical protein
MSTKVRKNQSKEKMIVGKQAPPVDRHRERQVKLFQDMSLVLKNRVKKKRLKRLKQVIGAEVEEGVSTQKVFPKEVEEGGDTTVIIQEKDSILNQSTTQGSRFFP